MPPHGRRRLSNFSLLLGFLFLFTSTASAASAVLGIDLGTEYIKAALVKPGVPLDIVLTKDSKRKETAAVAFKGIRSKVNSLTDGIFPERVYGGDAVALSARFPGDVYPNLKPLLGVSYQDDTVAKYQGWRPDLQVVELNESSSVGLKSSSFIIEEAPFMVEELLAMELKNVKANAETMAGKSSTIQDVVITIPSFYTVEERRAVSLAAELAGLRVLSLISDGLAVGLNYATSRTFPNINDGGKPETHLVFDMGAGSTTATILKFQGRTVKDVGKFNKTVQEVQVLGTSWDKSLGGDALNGVIVDDMIAKILETKHMKGWDLTTIHVKTHGRTMAKLWKEAERLRQILSANTETQTSMEGLYYEDFNFKYKLKRADFEKLTSDFAARVQNPIVEALETAKLSLTDVDSVILHGGAVRTPFVQKQLEALVKNSDKIKTNVNSDEAAVFGAAFKAAGISPSFRVKEIRAADTAVYPVFASYNVDGKEKQQKLFIPTSLVGATEKQVTFKVDEDFAFELFQQVSLPFEDHALSTIKSQNLTESIKALVSKGCETSDINTKFAIRLSPSNGLPEVSGATVSCEIANTKKSGSVVDGMKDFLGFGSKKDEQKPLNDDSTPEDSSSSVSDSSSSEVSSTSSSTSSKSSTTSSSEDAKATEKASKKKVESINVAFSTTMASSKGLNDDSLARIKTRLIAFDASDRSRVLREEALNTLEGYTYKIRDIVEDPAFMDASTQLQRDEIEHNSNEVSMWLYGDGADASREVLKARLDALRALVDPIQKRKEETINRPPEIEKLRDTLTQAQTVIDMVQQQQDVQDKAESELSASSSSSSSSAAAAASEASSSSTHPASETSTSTSTADPLDDLDDSPIKSSSTSTSSTPPTPLPPLYTKEEITSLTTKQTEVQTWLDTTLAQQDLLPPTADPILLTADLAAKNKDLNDAIMALLTKQMRGYPKDGSSSGGSGSGKKAKSSGAKSKKSKTTTTTATTASSSTLTIDPSSTATPSPEPGDDPSTKSPEEEQLEGMEGITRMSREELEEALKEGKVEFGGGAGGEEGEGKGKIPKVKAAGKAKTKGKDKGKGKGKTKAKTKGKGKGKGGGGEKIVEREL